MQQRIEKGETMHKITLKVSQDKNPLQLIHACNAAFKVGESILKSTQVGPATRSSHALVDVSRLPWSCGGGEHYPLPTPDSEVAILSQVNALGPDKWHFSGIFPGAPDLSEGEKNPFHSIE